MHCILIHITKHYLFSVRLCRQLTKYSSVAYAQPVPYESGSHIRARLFWYANQTGPGRVRKTDGSAAQRSAARTRRGRGETRAPGAERAAVALSVNTALLTLC